MRGWLDKLESRGRSVARFCALCGMLGLVALTLLTDSDVFMRWGFNSPIDGVADIAPLIVAIGITSFFPFALAERHHISINPFGGLLGVRARAWQSVLVAVVTLVFFGLLAWQIILYTVDLHESGQTTWVIQLPLAPWWTVVCLFMLLCVAVQFSVLVTEARRAFRSGDDNDDAPDLPEDAVHDSGGL